MAFFFLMCVNILVWRGVFFTLSEREHFQSILENSFGKRTISFITMIVYFEHQVNHFMKT